MYRAFSRSVISGVGALIHKNIVEEIRRKVLEMKESDWNITLCWVKAHAGVMGNELADTIAKRVVKNKNIPEIKKGSKKRSEKRS